MLRAWNHLVQAVVDRLNSISRNGMGAIVTIYVFALSLALVDIMYNRKEKSYYTEIGVCTIQNNARYNAYNTSFHPSAHRLLLFDDQSI